MPTVTEKKIQESAAQLEKLIKQAQRKLFELETLANTRAIQDGGFLEFRSARDLIRNVKRAK